MELREKILVTAIEQFRQTGLKFTMQDVAEQARISKKTIYTVFASKEELLLLFICSRPHNERIRAPWQTFPSAMSPRPSGTTSS